MCFLQGTWHAGPLFVGHPHMDFCNLELEDTNSHDYNMHDLGREQGVEFEIVEGGEDGGSQ